MKAFKTKVIRKLNRYKRKLIPFNHHLRPTGLHDEMDSESFKLIKIIPNCTTNLTMPGHLFNNLSPFSVYDKVSEDLENTLTHTADYEVCKVRNGRIYSNNIDLIAVISEDNKLINNVSFQYRKELTSKPGDSSILRQRFFEKPKYVKGTVFNMLAGGGAARGNYSHWLIDVLPRIYLLKESGHFDEVDWFVVPQYKYDFQKQTLNYFGIRDEQIIEGADPIHIKADFVISSSHPRGKKSFLIPKWVIDFYQNYFDLDKYIDSNSPKNIYISRKDSGQRSIVNEDEVISVLEKLGFKSLELSEYDFYGKIRLFRNAHFIASSTGAGLAALLFCKNTSKVFEFFSKSYTNSYYYNIADMMGMEYDFHIFDSTKNVKNMREGITDDLIVNPDTIAEKVKTMMQLNENLTGDNAVLDL